MLTNAKHSGAVYARFGCQSDTRILFDELLIGVSKYVMDGWDYSNFLYDDPDDYPEQDFCSCEELSCVLSHMGYYVGSSITQVKGSYVVRSNESNREIAKSGAHTVKTVSVVVGSSLRHVWTSDRRGLGIMQQFRAK